MFRMLRAALRALAVAGLLAGTALAQGTTLTIVHVNDSHSHLDAVGPKDANLDGTVGGLAKAATVIGGLKAADPDHTLFLHAGDAFMGDSYFNAAFGVPGIGGLAELRILRALGVDAMAVGNHEFWFGAGPLKLALSQTFPPPEVAFPLLAANLDPSADPYLDAWIAPSLVTTKGGVKVGVFGMVTPFDPVESFAPVVLTTTTPEAVIATAAAQVQALRGSGAQVVILLSHLGQALDEAIAANVPGIDLVVGGHDHLSYDTTVPSPVPGHAPVPLVQAGAHYRQVGKVVLQVSDDPIPVVTLVSAELIPIDASVPRLPDVEDAVRQLQAFVDWRYQEEIFHTPIATAAEDIVNHADPRKAKRDTPTGDLVTDALRRRTGTDFAFTAAGQTPEGIAAGPVVVEDLFRMVSLGFDPATGLASRIATFRISGAEIWKALETTLTLADQNADLFIQVSGLRYEYDSSHPAGSRLVSVRIANAPLDPARVYSATCNELVFALLAPLGVQIVEGSAVHLEDFELWAVRDFAAAEGTIDYASQNRIRDLALVGAPAR